MKKLNLVLGIYFAFVYVIWSLIFDDSPTVEYLFMEINIWVFRLFWTIISIFLISQCFIPEKSEKKADTAS